jgi:hypothetical protein
MPGTAEGTVAFSMAMVRVATSSTDACLAHLRPGTTMLGFSTMPSSATRCS